MQAVDLAINIKKAYGLKYIGSCVNLFCSAFVGSLPHEKSVTHKIASVTPVWETLVQLASVGIDDNVTFQLCDYSDGIVDIIGTGIIDINTFINKSGTGYIPVVLNTGGILDIEFKVQYSNHTRSRAQSVYNSVGDKIKGVFSKYDKNGDGELDYSELDEILKTWGIKLNQSNFNDLISYFKTSEGTNKTLNVSEFSEMMNFFILARQAFTQYDLDSSDTIEIYELIAALEHFKFSFSIDTVSRYMELRSSGSGSLNFQEFTELLLSIRQLHQHFLNEDKDNNEILDAAELQSLFRTLDVHITATEISICLQKLSQNTQFTELNFEGFVDLLHIVKNTLPQIQQEAKTYRENDRKKPPKREAAMVTRSISSVIIEKARNIAQSIIQQCQNSGQKWEDPDFPAVPESLFPSNRKRASRYIWIRPDGLALNPSLFVDGTEQGDVVQGTLGDCWLLSAFAVLAGSDGIEELFPSSYPEYGFYQCIIHKDGEWQIITVDDRIPCTKAKKIAFGRCKDNDEIWVPILEKAIAKYHGCYENLESGNAGEALTDLSGYPHEIVEPSALSAFWNFISESLENGDLIGCSKEDDSITGLHSDMGIIVNHAYSIIKCVELEGNRLLLIRNPWGKFEWTGRWSDGAKEWTPEILNKFEVCFEDDGSFYMEFNDFCEHFTTLYFLRANCHFTWEKYIYYGNWEGVSAAGSQIYHNWFMNPQYLIGAKDVSSPVFIYLSVKDRGNALFKRGESRYPPIGLIIIEKNVYDTYREMGGKLHSVTTYNETRNNTLSFYAETNKAYVVLPSTYDRGIESQFTLNIYSQYPIECEHLIDRRLTLTAKGAWSENLCGGCKKYVSSWLNNPKFMLVMQEDSNVTMTLIQPGGEDVCAPIGFSLCTCDNSGNFLSVLKTSSYSNDSSVSDHLILARGFYLIVPTTYNPGDRYTAFAIMVYSSGSCNLLNVN
eukprot:TRINITY_DN12184_c0_g1_i1.p1 TRINITY_DN12184_c0_g1~~TRINITY_DN12184_c0_g1_i1.p1  ORF type:complete len:959 (+),score=191.59 TRINITY_DN12184_c0_g1_i1:30-2879(+)